MAEPRIEKKKSLGQHFLHAQAHLRAIADAVEIVEGETVVEIGPGEGALTQELLARGAHVVAIEKDHRLIPLLKEKFAENNFVLVEGDALDFDICNGAHCHDNGHHCSYKVVGNIPYYITGALLKKFLEAAHQPSCLVFLMQKEVAERIARSEKESILSLSVKAFGTPKYVKTVPAGAFVPPPKVDSAVLVVSDISRDNFSSPVHEKKFFELVKKGFGQKRKQLKSNLKQLLGAKAEELGSVRAEDVPLQEWLELSRP